MIPETPDEFLECATECERLAAQAQDLRVKETFLYVASRWRALAAADDPQRKGNTGAPPPATRH
jgi:hypothetical protein